MLFMNYKLFAVARKSRRNNGISPEMKTISSCLLTVACFVVLNIPACVYIGLSITSRETVYLHRTTQSLQNSGLQP
jgi:hypothetical protein